MPKTPILLLSVIIWAVSCKRELPVSLEKQTTAASTVLTGQVASLALLAGSPASYPVQMGVVSTRAGSNPSSQIHLPTGVAIDAAGNIFVSDQSNSIIWKLATDGTNSVFAGNGVYGFRNGTRQTAEFANPSGLAFDAQGNLYVGDEDNHRIRIITTDGMVSTYAGSGVAGFADGPDSVAKFRLPTGVAVDAAGTVYVADYGNNRIRRVLKTKVVSQWAGSGNPGDKDGSGTLAQFNAPFGITATANGVVYVADMGNNKIRRIMSGVVTSFVGGGGQLYKDGTGTAASFNFPSGVAVDGSGNLYIADAFNNRVRKATPAGVVTTVAGSGAGAFADGYDVHASFNTPWGIGIGPNGVIYVGDRINNAIRQIVIQPAVRTLAGNGGQGYAEGMDSSAQINQPYSITVDKTGTIYFQDWDLRIRKLTPSGTTSLLAGSGIAGYAEGHGAAASFNSWTGIVTDTVGNVYVADGNNHRIRIITPSGDVSTFAGNGVPGLNNGARTGAVCQLPSSMVFDKAGNMYYTEYFAGLVRKIGTDGNVSTLAQLPKTPLTGSTDSSAATCRFIAIDAAGNIFAAAEQQRTIFKVTPAGVVSVFVGGWSSAAHNYVLPDFVPIGMAFDASGKMYVTLAVSNQVYVITPQGQISVLAGSGTGEAGFADAPNLTARFAGPMGIAINPASGVLYICDAGNSRIRIMSKQ